MRPIKFRAWDASVKEMMSVGSINFGQQPDSGHIWTPDSAPQHRALIAVVLMQFTGLLDKNGKEIYEGDVVRHFSYGDVWEVEYIPQAAGVVIHGRSGQCPLTDGCKHNIEVIGNIYENPDLLKTEAA